MHELPKNSSRLDAMPIGGADDVGLDNQVLTLNLPG